MKRKKSVKVIFDTNVWISFLIGKRLQSIKPLISLRQIKIILSDQLIVEIKEVTQKPKLSKYFPQDKVSELLELFELIGNRFKTTPVYQLCRDAKDNFFLDLIDISKADYLVTGDKDLLEIQTFKTAKILTPAAFEIEIRKLF